MSDMAHANGRLQTVPENTGDRHVTKQTSAEFDAAAEVLRLLIGASLVGGEEFLDRLRKWEAAARSPRPSATPESAPGTFEFAGASGLVRYALIGLLFDSQARARRRFSSLISRFVQLSDEAEYMFSVRLAPALRNTPLDPLIQLLDEATFTARSTVDRWTARGWLEEQRSRRVAQQAASNIVDELFAYMARNPDLRELIEQQGSSVAGNAVDHMRERTASADMWIERLAHSILHRPLSAAPEQPPVQTDAHVARDYDG